MADQLICPQCQNTYFTATFTRSRTETLTTSRRLIIMDDENEDWGLERDFEELGEQLPNGDIITKRWIDTVDPLVSARSIEESVQGSKDLHLQEYDRYDNLSVYSDDVEEEVTLSEVTCDNCGASYPLSTDFEGYNTFDE